MNTLPEGAIAKIRDWLNGPFKIEDAYKIEGDRYERWYVIARAATNFDYTLFVFKLGRRWVLNQIDVTERSTKQC